MNIRKQSHLLSVLALLLGYSYGASAQCWIYGRNDTAVSFWGVSFPDTNVGIAVGDAGVVARTTDSGRQWVASSTNPYYELHRLVFADARNGVTVGFDYYERSGLILRTTDAGESWTRQVSGITTPLWDISAPTLDVQFAVGLNGVILRTTNGGQDWVAGAGITDEDLIGVDFSDAQRGTIVGSNGIVLHTTDAGVTWKRQQSATGRSLYDVTFTDADHGTVVGNKGTILRTSDGGTTWISRNIDSSIVLISASFADGDTGTIVGWRTRTATGIIVRTTDGGVHWDSLTCPNYLYAIDARRGATAVGDDGTIIRRSDSCDAQPQVVLVSPRDSAGSQSLIPYYDAPPLFGFTWNVAPTLQVRGTRVEVSTDRSFTTGLVLDTLVLLDGSAVRTSMFTQLLLPGTSYHWRARTQFWNGATGGWSPTWSFATASGLIGGTVFEDLNRNGVQEDTERPFSHWRMDISGGVVGAVYTDSKGAYRFRGLGAGTYVVREAPQSPLVPSVPQGGSYSITMGNSDTVIDRNFGNYYGWNSVSGTLFHDLNDNGYQDPGEPGLKGWSVRAQREKYDSVRTDSMGRYELSGLVLGPYLITATMNEGWEQTYPQLQEGHGVYFTNFDQHLPGVNFALRNIPPRVKITLNVKDSTTFAHRNIWFGVRAGATYGIWHVDVLSTFVDYSEGEFELPPPLPGVFDARFNDPRSGTSQFGNGSWTDVREYISASQADTFHIPFQPGLNFGGDYPMLVRWSTRAIDTSFDGEVQISSPTGTAVDMKLVDSLLIRDPSVTAVTIIARGPRIPVVGIEEVPRGIPLHFGLLQNYPNPYNSSTLIRYELPRRSNVHLEIYDVMGRLVATLASGFEEAGYKSVRWNANGTPSGVYFYRLSAGAFTDVRKMLLLK